MKHYSIRFVALLATLFLLVPMASAQFAGTGSGTQSDPYRIFNADQLTQMRNFLNQEGVYFKLQNDINLTDWLADNYPGQGWQPVGSSSEPFKGVLDGNNKTISGFSINRSTADNVGLFGYISGATIKNLTIKGNVTGHNFVGAFVGGGPQDVSSTLTGLTHIGSTTGQERVGGIAGACAGNLSNLTVEGNVTGTYDVGGAIGRAGDVGSISGVTVIGNVNNNTSNVCTGGVAGYSNLNISNATYSGNVTGGSWVGGIIGFTSESITLSNITATGSVKGTATDFVGGICGRCLNLLTISNGTSRCDVTGKLYTGGIVGGSESGAVTLTSCYAEGDITGTTSVGGICGQIKNPGSSSISGCNYWGNITGTSQLGGVVGAISTDYTSPDFNATTTAGYRKYTGSYLNFSYISTACFYNTGSPRLQANSTGGFVTMSSIATDIDAWGISRHTVCSLSESGTYSAIYKVYNNLRTSSASTSINLNITNCSAVGNINGTSTHVGGIIGKDIDGNSEYYTVADSKTVYYYEGEGVNTTITSLTLKKYNYYYKTSNITDSYFSGNLTGTNYIGGIAGTKQGGQINKCYASASINGGQYIGGIAGALSKESLNTNENSLNANVSLCPSITGTSNVGRIYGSTDGNFSVAALGTNSENRSMATTQVVVNGVTQTITDDLQNGTAVGVSLLRLKSNYVAWGWDFNNKWTILDTESFPYKSWQTAPPTFSGKLTSGATTISGKSTDGGTVYLTTSSGKTYSATCSGTTWSVIVDALHAGETVTAYAASANKEKSYFTTTTVGFLGSGTEGDPYQIASAEDLQGLYKGGYYKVVNDINLTAWIGKYSASKGWLPVGYDGAAVYVDGGGHTITGLWTNSTDAYTGLFSKLKDGYIKNLNVEVASGKKVKGGQYTGILIAYATGFELSNCSVKGNAEGTKYVGGIAGYFTDSSSSQLSDLTYEGSLSSSTASAYIGGIAGQCTGGLYYVSSVVQISATGSNTYIGGLVGSFNNNSRTVSQCTAEVNISSSGTGCYIGGLIGKSSNTVTTGCYSSGTIQVTGNNSMTGGIAGYLSGGGISDNYSTATISGTQRTAGLVGQADGGSQINRCYATGNITGIYYGAGIVGNLSGTNTKTTNCVALNNQLTFTDQSSWAARVIGGYDNAAGDPDGSNLALATMQVSLNGVPVTKYDDLVEGVAKSEAELKQQATYKAMGWDFSDVWTMSADGYPVLKWQLEASEPDITLGDLSGDGKVSITDVVMIIDVMAGTITDANKVAAADVNGDGNVSITDCVAAIDLIAADYGGETPDGHAWVDLGLPSGTLWATCNVGASSPEEYGDYFAWGETEPKSDYSWSTYKYCEGANKTMTKYCTQSSYGYNGFTDNLTELQSEDDAATANWGSGWQMPSREQIQELWNSSYTTTEWTQVNGVYGRKITSNSNGNSIFLPAAGYRNGTDLRNAGSYGYYWSCSLNTSDRAHFLRFSSNKDELLDSYRLNGRSVRPVRRLQMNSNGMVTAGVSAPQSAKRKTHSMLSDTDFISAAMQENVLNISLDNERHYTAFQMTVSMPEGMTLGRATMDEMRGADHLVTVRDLGRGQYLVAGFSPNNEELMASSGRLLSIITEGQADADIVISDIEFATTQAEAYHLADVAVSGTPTGINEMKNEEMVDGNWYDLLGRRVTKTTKGIYIHNGKKTIIK